MACFSWCCPHCLVGVLDQCVEISGRQLSRVKFIKYLAIYIDENLTWQRHTQYVYQRMQSRLHRLYRLCPLPNWLLGRLYCTFVLPLLDYCDVVWLPSSVRRFERIHSRFCSLVPTIGFSWLNVDFFMLCCCL